MVTNNLWKIPPFKKEKKTSIEIRYLEPLFDIETLTHYRLGKNRHLTRSGGIKNKVKIIKSQKVLL